ncbi:MAG: DNA-processing protein DprA [Acidobacteriota bacterium]
MQTNNDINIRNTLEFTLLPNLGIHAQRKILGIVPNTAEIFSMSVKSLRNIGVPESTIQEIRSRAFRQSAEKILDWCARAGCRILISETAEFPDLLKRICDSPVLLYALGSLQHLDRPRIAIVGSRRPTVYGLQMAQGIASDLGNRGICIVSGLARGIDGAAHRGCLQAGGSTIAVLGCGIDRIYPPEHRQLKEQIVNSGIVISEYPPGTPPLPHQFPVRNRIISGLSLGSLVVEAGEKSGSLITARLALEQDREVFAIPGNNTAPSSYGTNFLIKQGAKLVQSWKDVVEEMPLSVRERILLQENERPSTCQNTRQLLDMEMEGLIHRLPGDMYILSGSVPEK